MSPAELSGTIGHSVALLAFVTLAAAAAIGAAISAAAEMDRSATR